MLVITIIEEIRHLRAITRLPGPRTNSITIMVLYLNIAMVKPTSKQLKVKVH